MALIKSLKSRNSDLAEPAEQLKLLNGDIFREGKLPTFREKLMEINAFPLKPAAIKIFQMNIGYMCNQTCKHCHVDAGPDRKEIMSRETMQRCIDIISEHKFDTVDITGGAPEMNPDFRWFITELRKTEVREIIVRCNLTIILANAKYNDLPEFFKANRIRVVSSLPFYNADRTDRQRGEGVFAKSVDALKLLNAVGYGMPDSGLILDLVYNPGGAFLPAEQSGLERDFKKELKDHFGIQFNMLLCLNNLPVSRFLEYLVESDNFDEYMDLLVRSFYPGAVQGVMCKDTISVDYDGFIYDCDFNQMLKMKVDRNASQHINDFDIKKLTERNIVINQHCFGCTAGAGSSCQGATT